MGILNVTPDSFSDGGQFLDPGDAIAHAARHGGARRRYPRHRRGIHPALWRRQAGIGGRRNGAARRRCCRRSSSSACRCRSTPSRRQVAAWALDQGAAIVNDVWGLQRDPDMAPLVAERGVPVDRHAQPRTRRRAHRHRRRRHRLLRPLARDRRPRRHRARRRSCSIPASASARRRSKASSASARLAEFKRFGLPILVGASRKRFINSVSPSQPGERIGGSIAAHLLAVANGAAIVRVHDVAETVQALRVAAAIEAAR